jgi:hypothetical protein
MASGRVIKNIMKAICVRQFGGPEVLKVEENFNLVYFLLTNIIKIFKDKSIK